MKKNALKFTTRNIFQTKGGRWVFRKKINKQEIYRTLKSKAQPTPDAPIPEEVMKEVEMIVGLAFTGQKKEYEKTKLRKSKAATIGEIIEAFNAFPLTKTLARRTRTGYVNALYQIIATVHLPEYSNLSGSRIDKKKPVRPDRPKTSKAELRNEAINKMSGNILNAELISRWMSKRMERGPVYRGHEIAVEKDSDELTKKELRRVLTSMRTALNKARSLFASNPRATVGLMCSKKGAYRNLKLPDCLHEFLGVKTAAPGKTKYKAPNQREILTLISGLPKLYTESPEAYKAFKIAYSTGLRIDEIRKLKWADILEKGKTYTIVLEETKNGDERINEYLGEKLFDELWEMKSDSIYVIGGGKEYRTHGLGRDVSIYFRSKGWTRKQCLHELRKWFGSMLAEETKDLSVVMKALGHQDLATTQNYYHDQITETHNPAFAQSLPAPGLEVAA